MMEQIGIFSTISRRKMKKKQLALESALEKSDFSDTLAEHPAVQWISQNGRSLLWLLLGLIALFLIGYRLLGTGGSKITSYFTADKEMSLFLAGGSEAKESLEKLSTILSNNPDLQPKYDGRIAQKLMDRGEISASWPFADRTLTRLSQEHLLRFYDYSTTTLLIEKEHFPEALEQALALQQKINENESALYAANLLRIAMLNQKLGNKSEELKTWRTLKQNLKQDSPVLSALSEGKLSLLDYIAFREKEFK